MRGAIFFFWLTDLFFPGLRNPGPDPQVTPTDPATLTDAISIDDYEFDRNLNIEPPDCSCDDPYLNEEYCDGPDW